ncbi:MAG: hypothetical protein NC114_03520 [Ruminococcus flavefaciens]|nr:hypothetical protein [Ruminococcus flavefaciens]
MNEYTIKAQKEGFKEATVTVTKTGSYNLRDSLTLGVEVKMPMKEDLGNLVTLKGTIAAAGLTMPEAKLNTLYLVLSSKGKLFNSEIRNGAYEFKDVPVGKVSCYLTTTDGKSLSYRSRNWQFTDNNRDSLEFDLAGEDGDMVSKNLNVKRVGVDVTGLVANGEGGYPAYLSYVKVKLSNETYSDSAETYGYDGFLISGVEDGVYKLEYTKVGYITVRKDITVDMSKMAVDSVATVQEVTLHPSVEADYIFSGRIQYPTAEAQMVKVENATVEMYGMDGALLADTVTDTVGMFSFKVRCLIGTEFRFMVFHESIDTATTTAIVEGEENTVDFSIFAKIPELFGMINAKAAQIEFDPKARLTWEWPQALKDAYVDENGEGVYQISQVLVFRQEENETGYAQIGTIDTDFLANTVFVDSTAALEKASSLQIGATYNYYLQVRYSKPFAFGKPDNVVVRDAENLTVTLRDKLPDSVSLVLNVNDASYGEVSGAGKYVKGSAVNINATAKTGYEFVAWMSGTDTVACTAAYKLVLDQDSTLTAVFAKTTVANDKREMAQWSVYAENGCLVICSNTACRYEVYSVSGVLVRQGALNGECRVDVGGAGLYMVRRISPTGISVKKLIVR